MAVQDQTPYNQHVGNALTTVFAFGFLLLIESDLKVYLDGVLQTGGYTVSGVGNPTGGTVTFSAAPGTGVDVLLQREIPLERLTDYQTAGDLLATTLNRDFDRLWMALQSESDINSRQLTLPVGSGASGALPDLVAAKFLRVKSTADGIELADMATLGALGVPVSLADGGVGASHADVAAVRATLGALASNLTTLTALTAPALDDLLATWDTSAVAIRGITLADLLKVLNALTEDTTPDVTADFVLTYDASASAVKKVKPQNLLPISKVSPVIADQIITTAGPLTLAHGLGVVPTLVMYYLVCQTGELGYTAGDIVHIYPDMDSTNAVARSFSSVLDATNINIRFGNSANVFTLVNKGTGAIGAATNGNWKLRVKAWA